MTEIVYIEIGTTPMITTKRDKSWDDYERNRYFGRERPYDRDNSHSRDRSQNCYDTDRSYNRDDSYNRDRAACIRRGNEMLPEDSPVMCVQ